MSAGGVVRLPMIYRPVAEHAANLEVCFCVATLSRSLSLAHALSSTTVCFTGLHKHTYELSVCVCVREVQAHAHTRK